MRWRELSRGQSAVSAVPVYIPDGRSAIQAGKQCFWCFPERLALTQYCGWQSSHITAGPLSKILDLKKQL